MTIHAQDSLLERQLKKIKKKKSLPRPPLSGWYPLYHAARRRKKASERPVILEIPSGNAHTSVEKNPSERFTPANEMSAEDIAKFCAQWEPLVSSVTKDWYIKGYSTEDLHQEARVAVYKAAKIFDPNKGCFFTVAKRSIKNIFWTLLERAKAQKRIQDCVRLSGLKPNERRTTFGEIFNTESASLSSDSLNSHAFNLSEPTFAESLTSESVSGSTAKSVIEAYISRKTKYCSEHKKAKFLYENKKNIALAEREYGFSLSY